MKYLRYGCLSISKNILFTFIMVLEVVALLVTTNVTIGSANNKSVLTRPFDDIVNKEGYYCFFEPMWETQEEATEFYGLFNKLKSATIISSDQIDANKIVDDDIFFKYSMPLQSGSWPKTATDEQGRPYVVVSPDYIKNVGETITTDGVGECVISGVLTEVTYIPAFTIYNEENVVTSFYRSADYTVAIEAIKAGSSNELKYSDSAIIMAKSAYKALNDNKDITYLNCFITYDDNISKADMEYNKGIMKQITEFQKEHADFYPIAPTFTPLSQIKDSMDTYVTNSYINILPIIFVVAAIVLIGLIGSVAINTVTQIRNYGIYFLCGSKWSDCFKISLANISIILLFSGVLSGVLLYCSKFINLNYLIGQVYEWNNLYISLGVILAMMLLALIIPFGIIRFTSPVEVIKSKK